MTDQATSTKPDFFVSYTGADRAWAVRAEDPPAYATVTKRKGGRNGG